MPIVADNFNRANSANLGPSWTVWRGGLGVSSNKAVVPSAGFNFASGWTADTFTSGNYFVRANVNANGVSNFVGVLLLGSPGAGVYSGYRLTLSAASGGTVALARVVSSTATTLASATSVGFTTGEVPLELRAEVFGDRVELRAFLNGTLITSFGTGGLVTDSNAARHTSGTLAIAFEGDLTQTIDDFEGGDFSGGEPPAGPTLIIAPRTQTFVIDKTIQH